MGFLGRNKSKASRGAEASTAKLSVNLKKGIENVHVILIHTSGYPEKEVESVRI